MLDKLKKIKDRYDELSEIIASPDAMRDMDKWRKQVKEHSALEPIVAKYQEYMTVTSGIDECRALLGDPEMKELAQEELDGLKERQQALWEEIKIMLLPKDPNDERNVVMEIRAGTGGEEAALFGSDLFRMYTRYAERNGFGFELVSESTTDMGGVKEAVFVISGRGAYSRLKYESGVHRVQRVPDTESSGRIHTSAATVAVLPEVEDIEVEINPNDIRVDVYRSGGHGGQSVNTTDSAVRVTHIPTGIVVTCQDEKSQLKNKDKAMRVLKSRLYEHIQSQKEKEYSENRKSQVGTGDRSERIRTYNFPQGRVTDHRVNLTLYKLEQFLDGDLDEIIDALVLKDRTEKIAGE